MQVLLVPLLPLLLVTACLHGCADRQILPRLTANGTLGAREEIRITDPEGPIPAPRIPPELARAAAATPATRPQREGGYAYEVEALLDPDPRTKDGHTSIIPILTHKPGDPELLLSDFENSQIYRLKDEPPQTLVGLEQRLAAALDEARKMLTSRGYYSGRVRGVVVPPEQGGEQGGEQGWDGKGKAVVRVTFRPGPLYRIGRTRILADTPVEGASTVDKLPATLADAGLAEGAPAQAEDVLAAVDRAREIFLDNGYPFATVASTRYIADHPSHTLEAEIRIIPGLFVRMGDLDRDGAPTVRERYFAIQTTWEKGEPWNQSKVEAFRDSLRQSGLFQSVIIEPAPQPDEQGFRAVHTSLTGAPERTLSGAVKYHSDFGPGVQGSWEHRNRTGNGDTLRYSLPLWLDMQEFTASYRLPYFLRRDQDLIAKAGFLNQDTDAYRLTSAAGLAGIERRLSRFWTASVQGSVEGGTIKEPNKQSRDYLMFGLPLGFNYDNTGSLLDAVRGQRLKIAAAPYQGRYEGNFSVLRTRLDAHAFLPLKGEDSLILALRGSIGAIGGADSDKVPPSIRFYSGGGGSVRGYEYQSLGPRDEDRKPLGGGSFAELSAETRWKLTPEWGLVAFVDGGTAYQNVFEDPGRIMRWGAGVGVRYYTVIGPVRFDLATPLNPRSDDESIQFYISIGQSF